MKVGVIRCRKQQENCLFAGCLDAMKNKTVAFEGVTEDIEMAGINDCGGCPGEKVVERAVGMVRMGGADTIVLTSCATQRDCEHSKDYMADLEKRLTEGVSVVDRDEFRRRMSELPPLSESSREEIAAARAKLELECEKGTVKLGNGLKLLDRTH